MIRIITRKSDGEETSSSDSVLCFIVGSHSTEETHACSLEDFQGLVFTHGLKNGGHNKVMLNTEAVSTIISQSCCPFLVRFLLDFFSLHILRFHLSTNIFFVK